MSRVNENKIVVATNNKGKLKEIRKYFDPFNCRMIAQEELKIESIPETGDSFKTNALQKAVHLASFTNYPIIADDSGLVVDALNGEPGIYSARYAGVNANAGGRLFEEACSAVADGDGDLDELGAVQVQSGAGARDDRHSPFFAA